MLTSIRQVNEEFFRIFHGIKVNIGDSKVAIPCRYAKKSSMDYAEEQENQIYPCIAIQDYTPTVKDEWYVDLRSYFGGASSDDVKGYLYRRPVWMNFRYDVSIAAKRYNEFTAMQDYFMQNFIGEGRFIFNKQLSGYDAVGDLVPYTVKDTDIPRNDGVHEINYEFNCAVWVYLHLPKEVDLIKEVILRGSPFTFQDLENIG